MHLLYRKRDSPTYIFFWPALISSFFAACLYALKKSLESLDDWWTSGRRESTPWYIATITADRLESPFALQIACMILAYLISSRVSIAMDRFNDGYSNIQFMTSKWADAFMQLRAFAFEEVKRNPHKEKDLQKFLLTIMHKFSLLSAIAFCKLAEEKVPDPDLFP